jgi:hypothetical protein
MAILSLKVPGSDQTYFDKMIAVSQKIEQQINGELNRQQRVKLQQSGINLLDIILPQER